MEGSAEISFSQLSEVGIKEIVSSAIHDLAKRRGLSLYQVHEQSGVGWNSIVGMAHGSDNSTLEKIEKLAKFFGLSGIQFLLFGSRAFLQNLAAEKSATNEPVVKEAVVKKPLTKKPARKNAKKKKK